MTTYRFYGLLDLECDDGGHRGYRRFLENEYARIAEAPADEAPLRIDLRVVAELPAALPGDIVRTVRFKRLFTYRFLVRDLKSERVQIFFRRHPVDRVYMNAIGVFLQAHVLEPVMYLKLLERGVLFLHAAGVARDGAGYLLPARGGAGKTTFSLALLEHGFRLLGDDLLLVDTKARVVHPYPRPLHLFAYNVDKLAGLRVPTRHKAAIYAKNVARAVLERGLRTDFLIATRVHLDELAAGDLFAPSVPYHGLWFLRSQGETLERRPLTEDKAAAVAAEIVDASDLNKSLYRILGAGEELASVQALEEDVVKRLLLQLPHVTYVNTRRLDLRSLDSFIQTVLDDGSPASLPSA